MKFDRMGWNGMEWDGMGWNGMEWDGMGWNGMEWRYACMPTYIINISQNVRRLHVKKERERDMYGTPKVVCLNEI